MKNFNIKKEQSDYVICLAGNPNTGKSSIFNKLTGLKQHTGNWPGKTVSNARGRFKHKEQNFVLVDVPGTYSLFGLSEEEIIARDFICFGEADAVVVVCDATSLQRNLNLVLQAMEYNKRVIMVVNIIDEARKKGILINRLGLTYELGIPVIFTSTKTNEGLQKLKDLIYQVVNNEIEFYNKQTKYPLLKEDISSLSKELSFLDEFKQQTIALRILDGDDKFFESMSYFYDEEVMAKINNLRKTISKGNENREYIIEETHLRASNIAKKYIQINFDPLKKDKEIDKVITSRIWGIPLMFLLLFVVFFITIKLANYPSDFLYSIFNKIELSLDRIFIRLKIPTFLNGLLIKGIYRTLTFVISVMLPPMAIFFPMFTLLEDFGYLPRVAYNLDHGLKKAGCHGKQSLTMCMGFGCNSAGVVGCRIIDSPREKLIAIITNTFVPCNGRFPLIITISSTFFIGLGSRLFDSIMPSIIVCLLVAFGICITMLVSFILSKTLLKGNPSTFTLELPPYRKPKILQVLYTSFIDRTIFVLLRAIAIAAPAGAVIWLLSNTYINGQNINSYLATFLHPFGKLLGLDGIILLAFILAIPANEIVLPLIIMGYSATQVLDSVISIESIHQILLTNNWTVLTAINVLLFSLLHYPCSTTLLTIYQETKSKKWTFLAFLIPTIVAISICLITNGLYLLLKLLLF